MNLIHTLYQFHIGIKLIYESSKEESIAFLELKGSIKNYKIITDLYVKSTNRHIYLHYLTAPPNHTKRTVVFNHTLCISRFCSYKEHFIKNRAKIKLWFSKE